MLKAPYTPEQSVKMLRIRFPGLSSCIAALEAVAHLDDGPPRDDLVEDLFVAFEVAGFYRDDILQSGLSYCNADRRPMTDTAQEKDTMARPKGIPNKPSTTKRQQAIDPFHVALQSAEDLLKARKEELAAAQQEVSKLQIEIPNLEYTIQALKRQLSPASPSIAPSRNVTPIHGAGINEVTDAMGVKLSTPPDAVDAPQQLVPDLDSAVPGMEGEWK